MPPKPRKPAAKKPRTSSKRAIPPPAALPQPPGDAAPLPEGSEEPTWLTAVRAADAKQARDLVVLDLRPSSFADFFVIATGSNAKQIQAISDEIGKRLAEAGEKPVNVEGYANAEWILADYGDLVIHIFSDSSRAYYDLERLWRDAARVPIPAPAGV